MSTCTPCPAIICIPPDDLGSGGADSALYAVNQLAFEVTCPAGCYCPPGLFPRVIIYLPSQIPPVIPSGGGSSPYILRLQGCSAEISRTLAGDATHDQLVAAASSIQAEWGGQQALCDAAKLPGIVCAAFFNDLQTFSCPGGGTMAGNGILPSFTVVDKGPGGIITLFITNDSNDPIQGSSFSFDQHGAPILGLGTVNPGVINQSVLSVSPGTAAAWELKADGVLFYDEPSVANSKDVHWVSGKSAFPGGVSFNPVSLNLEIAAGLFSGDTKAEANAKALAFLNALGAQFLANGVLTCT